MFRPLQCKIYLDVSRSLYFKTYSYIDGGGSMHASTYVYAFMTVNNMAQSIKKLIRHAGWAYSLQRIVL